MPRRTGTRGDPLGAFADRAVRVAEKVSTNPKTRAAGTFHGDKVFTHAVWAAGKFNMTLNEFKEKLVEAHRARLLTLARADLVAAMDPYDVKRSNTEAGGATYNFIALNYGKFAD